MILSGLQTEQVYGFNYLKLLKNTGNIKYSLSNRIDNKTTPNILQWGDSVLIGIDYNKSDEGFNYIYGSTDVETNYIKIFDISDNGLNWEVRKATDHWILISIKDQTNTTNFLDYFSLKNPKSDEDYRIVFNKGLSNQSTRYVRKIEPSKNYVDLKVEMKALDTLSQYVDFGNMNMKADLAGNIIVYNLSISFYSELEENNIEGILFDLCIQSDEYRPIIRGLKFEEKIRDLDYLIFSHFTNNGKQYVIFTTRDVVTDYAIYPDIFLTDNLYNNISTDDRVPTLFNNFMNDIYVSEMIQTIYTGTFTGNISISNIKFCKEVFEDNILYDRTIEPVTTSQKVIESNDSITILEAENYTTQVNIFYNAIGGSTTQFDMVKAGDFVTYTYDGTGYDPYIQTRISVGDFVRVSSPNISRENSGQFEVTAVGLNFFTVYNPSGVNEYNKTIGSGNISFSNAYLISYEGKIFLLSNNEKGGKRYNLTSLYFEFTNVVDLTEKEFRSILVYYDDSVYEKELLYLSHNPVVTIFTSEQKTFRIVI